MRLLMVSGDRQVVLGERGPFHAMQREFSRYFERIDVLCPKPPGTPSVFSIHDNVHFHPASVGRLKMVPWIASRGQELIEEHKHQLIVSHDYGFFYNGFGSARLSRRTRVPYLSEIHHVPGVPVVADRREAFDRFVARRYISWAKNRAAAFRVVNDREMPDLLRSWGVPKEKILVLPSLYIDLETFRPTEQSPEFDQDIVFVGRLVNNKGLFAIAEALQKLKEKKGRAPRILFVGRGPMRAALEERLKGLQVFESARFIDWVDGPEDLAEIYRRSRVILCASTCEGGPRVTVEAMACGTPVVSTPVGVMTGLLENGEAGKLCGFDGPSIANSLEAVLSNEESRRAMGSSAHAIAQGFEYASILRGYATGLQRLAGEPEGIAGGRSGEVA